MTLEIQLILWTTGLSLVVTYAWWTHFRVWVLRQDLFEIRDRLWDIANTRGLLDHPAYRDTRDGINALIRFAPWLSLPAMFRILFDGITRTTNDIGEMPPPVEQAIEAAAKRVVRYLLFETLSGIIISALSWSYRSKAMVDAQVNKWIKRVFASDDLRQLSLAS